MVAALAVRADVRNCACDAGNPVTLEARECSLCREALKQPADRAIFLLKDNNPTKPNRWLAIPRAHFSSSSPLDSMTPAERAELWDVAIGKGREMWGDAWAIAMNGDLSRTQCHPHVHIGKLLPGNESEDAAYGNAFYVDKPEDIPPPKDGEGLWFHPAAGKLHVHEGAQINETVLMR
jgi:diadenosine tetraphosphate (Ap4A) HIT family hydrolase